MSMPEITSKPFIIGLAGPSGSGKSTVAKGVASRLGGHVISMETYSADMNHLQMAERSKLNYDLPEAIDVTLLANHIAEFVLGNAIEVPTYDFAQHLRSDRREHLTSKPLLIVEGILALHFSELRRNYDLSIYLEAADDVCLHRRQVRDITERQRSLEFIRWQYENTVLPAARQYLLPSKCYADLVLESNSDAATVERNLLAAITAKRAFAAAGR